MLSSNPSLPLKPTALPSRPSRDHGSWLIAAGKFMYGLILVAAGLSIFNLIGKSLSAELWRLVNFWHIDSHLYYVNWLLHKAAQINDHQLWLLALANFVYATLSFIEAVGLARGKRWAQWLVIADTASFIPIETYQLFHSFNWINLTLLVIYFAIVIYLIIRLKPKPVPAAEPPPPLPLTLLRAD
ncbi:MAG TPA: DUF2127 domain-containing protein [Verrucomicrobiae bacterium]|jgi:uncharacterized membrane protein (DUF2068 family)